jgi:hypothetical protein
LQKGDVVVGIDELLIVHQMEDMFVMMEHIVLRVLVELLHLVITLLQVI